MAKIKLTSITEAAASSFIKKAKEREMLTCSRIKGFHLQRMANGGSWRYRYTDAIGKRRTATLGKFPEMMPEVAAKELLELNQKTNGDPLREKKNARAKAISAEEAKELRTLGHYFKNTYTEMMKKAHWPERSIKMNVYWMKKNFEHLFNTPMDEIGKAQIDNWAYSQQERGIAHSTIKRIFAVIRAIINRAVQDEVIAISPLEKYKLPAPKFEEEQANVYKTDELKEKRRMLSNDEIQALHDGLDTFTEEIRQQRRNSRSHGKKHLPCFDAIPYPHWFVPFCLMALHTGLRPGDIYSLTWQELNIPFNKLKKLTGKSRHAVRRGQRGTLVDMKLNATIHGIMKAWWEQHSKPTTGLVFPSPVTGDMMTVSAHKRPWATVKTLAELPQELDLYSLRHHFVSSLIAQGRNLFSIAKLAGHKNIEMIQEHYGHLSPDEADEPVDVTAGNISQAIAKAVK